MAFRSLDFQKAESLFYLNKVVISDVFIGVVSKVSQFKGQVILRFSTLFCLIMLLFAVVACDDDSNTLAPGGPGVEPVEWAAQLEGRWSSINVAAAGFPVTQYLIPAFTPGSFNARLASFDTDLVVGVTGEKSGLFSLIATGTAADTANPLNTASGGHDVLGGFTIDENGQLVVTLRAENSTILDPAQSYTGGARIVGDTLLLDFTLAAPPDKPVPFLPDTTTFIARLIKR